MCIRDRVLPVSEKTLDYATEVYDKIMDAGIRVQLDDRNEKIGYKIREAQQVDRANYMLILGAKEVESGVVSVRDRDTLETTEMTLDAFIEKVNEEINSRKR